jgi:hypothetical protein
MKMRVLAVGIVALAGSAVSALGATVNFGFTRITANAAQNVASQFNVAVSDVSGQPDQVTFKFTNAVGIASSISEIYYDDRSPLQLLTLNATLVQVGCSFSGGGANPGNLPGGASLTPAFNAIQSFSADAVGNPSVGIDTASDSLTMRFTLQPGASFASVINAMNVGTLRIGLHVRSIGTQGESDGFVNSGNPPVIPLPAAAWMGLAGLAGIAIVRRRR